MVSLIVAITTDWMILIILVRKETFAWDCKFFSAFHDFGDNFV